jgi:hypothetical protein
LPIDAVKPLRRGRHSADLIEVGFGMTVAFRGSQSAQDAFLVQFDGVTKGLGANFGSLAGLLTGGGDTAVLADRTGYPPGLLMLLERLFDALAQVWFATGTDETRTLALAAVRRWFADVAPGSDLAPVAGRLAIWLINDAAERSRLAVHAPELDLVGRKLIALHVRTLAGEAVARKEWAEVRNAAISINNTLPSHPTRWAGMAIEAGSWDPASSMVVLSDVLRPVNEIHARAASEATGWTDEDRDRAQALLDGLVKENRGRHQAGETVDFSALFQAADPDLHLRSGIAYQASSRASSAFYQEILEVTLAFLGDENSLGNPHASVVT